MYEYSFELDQWRALTNKTISNEENYNILGEYNENDTPRPVVGSAYFVSPNNTFIIAGGWNTQSWRSYYDGKNIFKFDVLVWEFDPNEGEFGQWRKLKVTILDDYSESNWWFMGNPYGEYSDVNHPPPWFNPGNQFHRIVKSTGEYIIFIGSRSAQAYANQIWKYDYYKNQWAGESRIGALFDYNDDGFYNEMGVCLGEDSNNVVNGTRPRARGDYVTWWEGNSEVLFLFGGSYLRNVPGKVFPVRFFLSDLWKYALNVSSWCWINGVIETNVEQQLGTNPYEFDADNLPTFSSASSYWQTEDDRFMMFGGIDTNIIADAGSSEVWEYDPASNMFRYIVGEINPPNLGNYSITLPQPRLMATSVLLSNGDVVVFGGYGATPVDDVYNDLWRLTLGAELGDCNGTNLIIEEEDDDNENDNDDNDDSREKRKKTWMTVGFVGGGALVLISLVFCFLVVVTVLVILSRVIRVKRQKIHVENADSRREVYVAEDPVEEEEKEEKQEEKEEEGERKEDHDVVSGESNFGQRLEEDPSFQNQREHVVFNVALSPDSTPKIKSRTPKRITVRGATKKKNQGDSSMKKEIDSTHLSSTENIQEDFVDFAEEEDYLSYKMMKQRWNLIKQYAVERDKEMKEEPEVPWNPTSELQVLDSFDDDGYLSSRMKWGIFKDLVKLQEEENTINEESTIEEDDDEDEYLSERMKRQWDLIKNYASQVDQRVVETEDSTYIQD